MNVLTINLLLLIGIVIILFFIQNRKNKKDPVMTRFFKMQKRSNIRKHVNHRKRVGYLESHLNYGLMSKK
ncbi:MAG: hypothetical protein H8E57_06375 [Candidatus Cloacimonetes bacterium]|nr:hypothetical protein [Candidatus Cloacimonadota bacterium]